MHEGILEEIRAVGHWRINFQPLEQLQEPLTLVRCREIVEHSSVSIRGWDFPHINRRNDESGGFGNVGTYVENWTSWSGFLEFWRLYRSSQFLSYVALREDTKPFGEEKHAIPVLNTVSTIYSITEFVEFLSRVHSQGLYQGGVRLSIELRNTSGRFLSAGMNRIPFFDRYVTQAETINVERSITRSRLMEDHRGLASEIALEIFDHFGWNPARAQIDSEIERFYRREWSS
jgi:hypothetical protein